MDMTLFSAMLLILMVIDPFGSVPIVASLLKDVKAPRRNRIIIRECTVAFCVLLLFMFFGSRFLKLLHLSQMSLGVAGGVVLFLIALRMIFPRPEGVFGDPVTGETFIVPLAVPLIAGPSAAATVLLLASKAPDRIWEWILAMTVAILVSMIVLLGSASIIRWIGQRSLIAIERLMGLILTAIAIEMFMNGVRDFVRTINAAN